MYIRRQLSSRKTTEAPRDRESCTTSTLIVTTLSRDGTELGHLHKQSLLNLGRFRAAIHFSMGWCRVTDLSTAYLETCGHQSLRSGVLGPRLAKLVPNPSITQHKSLMSVGSTTAAESHR